MKIKIEAKVVRVDSWENETEPGGSTALVRQSGAGAGNGPFWFDSLHLTSREVTFKPGQKVTIEIEQP